MRPRFAASAWAAAIAMALFSAPVTSAPAVDLHLGLPPVQASETRRCTDDGTLCISLDTYIPDVCTAIARVGGEEGLNPDFLARLLWKESRFEPGAISPAGAEGIAQFIPSTARIRGLDDAFNPAQAIRASGKYLAELTQRFGNLGLAAVAYNGGEGRASRFLAGSTVLPYETQDYVEAITGHNAWAWRDAPPAEDQIKLELDPQTPFLEACIKLAGNRELREFRSTPRVRPWGMIVASHRNEAGARRMAARVRPLLGGQPLAYIRRRMTGNPRQMVTAQVGFDRKIDAAKACARLKSRGGRCIVLKN